MIEKDREGYEVRKLPYGEVCIWYPHHFVLECECGGLLLCADSDALCRCGADHTDLARDLLDNYTDAASYPWCEDRPPVPEAASSRSGNRRGSKQRHSTVDRHERRSLALWVMRID